ncbi:2-C-methyl-D-erythritol 4-phosphate cytidylyltransferase [Acinetobacter sp. ANC 4862]|uniref:2-C-methyl-D-erythritol 4-phosphate cytidylyltransferase n=1 Tax=Acinetobacter sp. ANC 4862 TaxID=2529849 RepID=UPI00103C533F|nr:2-C-methyl-D-erythritol 4-phosphate cytidylyltransferase [Acinetobacter sp. ANC 4862]TCH63076.1 2-C-methyl-D-erythritol 4-phosphate cytidylyltransferase [Acinetobacter sp. ANC 4862]
MPEIYPQMHHKIWAVIPAAGSGSRFSKTELKQYQMIQGQTVLEHTISRLNDLPLSGYVLAISEDDSVAKTLNFTQPDKAYFCVGGAERVNSVLNGLTYLSQIASPDDLVFVHDAARPCVTQDCLNRLVNTAIQENCSAILAIPVRDTLKLVEQANNINKTVSRDYLWQAQTPQISKLGILKHAIEKALQDGITITDEASALEYVGEIVKVVQGRSDNIKITYSDDLELAKLILTVQK